MQTDALFGGRGRWEHSTSLPLFNNGRELKKCNSQRSLKSHLIRSPILQTESEARVTHPGSYSCLTRKLRPGHKTPKSPFSTLVPKPCMPLTKLRQNLLTKWWSPPQKPILFSGCMIFLDYQLGCAQSCDFITQACLSLHSQLRLLRVTLAFELIWEDVQESVR